ncbi:MAG: ScpA family protein [Pseudomonadota bacterium]
MPDGDAFSDLDARLQAEALIVDVDGYEGPLDVLLTLARTQKVDLRQISVLALARQYLSFVEQAKSLRIELAADYLVMAAWLAFLKSRLLLPPDPTDDGPTGDELAAHLAFQLERLAAMRDVAARLMGRDQKGRDFFARGITEDVARVRKVTYTATLLDLLQGYARIRTRDEFRPYAMDRDKIMTMEQALDRMRGLLSYAGDWADLATWLPEGWNGSPAEVRSATASHFAAALELVKNGALEIKQSETFGAILVKRSDHG